MVTPSIGVVSEAPKCPESQQREFITYSPSLWGDIFGSYTIDEELQEKYSEDIERLKEEVRRMLISGDGTKIEKLIFIDTLERLGVAYHFEKEIVEQLGTIPKIQSDHENGDLSSVALEFRLLRQHYIPVSCEVFNKFKYEDNKFDETISSDAEGLLSLYEASQARIHGEEFLDEAEVYTTHHLKHMLPQLKSPLQDKVKRALEQSLHRGTPIIEARYYIDIYQKDVKKNELLLQFAKINFKFLQNLYKKELCDIWRFWNEFDILTKVPFTRDRMVECYFWGVGLHYEPQYSLVRAGVAHTIQLLTVLDDTFDRYAKLEDAQLFTEIFERWDVNEIDPLPEYMKIIYRYVLSIYEEFEREASEQQRPFVTPYAIETVKQLVRSYLIELKWFMGRKMPKFGEYLANSEITSTIYIILASCFMGMKSVSEETIKWFRNEPKMAVVTAQFGRYKQDLSGIDREKEEGQVFTAIECYMNEYGLSKEDAVADFLKTTEDGWKNINTEMLNISSFVPRDLIDLFLNFARATEVTYKHGHDGYTNPQKNLAPLIAALFIDPVIL